MALYETDFCIWTGNFYVNLNLSGEADLKEIYFYNLKHKTHLKMVFFNVALTALPFSHWNNNKSFPYYGPSRPPGIMILINLILYYVRKLLYKSEHFWLSGSWEENFLMTPTLYLHFSDYLPVEEDLVLDLYNFIFPLPEDNLY
jgi:hypothetical protein